MRSKNTRFSPHVNSARQHASHYSKIGHDESVAEDSQSEIYDDKILVQDNIPHEGEDTVTFYLIFYCLKKFELLVFHFKLFEAIILKNKI